MRLTRKYALFVLTLGLILFGLTLPGGLARHPSGELLSILFALSLYGENRAIYIRGYGALNFGEGLYFAAALCGGSTAAAGLAALCGLLMDCWVGKKDDTILFNFGWALATFSSVGLGSDFLGGAYPLSLERAPVLLVCLLVYLAVGGGLQAGMQVGLENLPLGVTAGKQLQLMKVTAPAALSLAATGLLLVERSAWAITLLAVPIEMFSSFIRSQELHRQLETAHRELGQAQSSLLASGRQAALGVMAAGVAHEINNPLAAMRTTLHLLASSRPGESPQAVIELMERALDRCQSVVERMLTYSRKPRETDVAACTPQVVLDDTLLFLERRLADASCKVAGDLRGLPEVRCHPSELVQVFTNLLTNAGDAMATAGGTIRLSGESRGQEVHLLVRDHGPGIAPEHLDSVFEPFFTTKQVGQGTGLGLSIVQGIVRSHGGAIQVAETGPGGTTFRVVLPRA
ncbi:MAG: HAMP domain-containing histidine kinase [Armatimonadetes bacterium]|nr:HAMP domain-containing histidine kinase [Armatimonadota bacterium]